MVMRYSMDELLLLLGAVIFNKYINGCRCGSKYKIIGKPKPGRCVAVRCLRCGRFGVLDDVSDNEDRILKTEDSLEPQP